MSSLLSVNLGRPREAPWAAIGRTAIDKTPTRRPVPMRFSGLDGDEVADTRHHGGIDKAVYAFAREDLDHWSAELDLPIAAGQFGENLTTQGIDVNEAEIGERWEIGDALVEVRSVRTPCNDFKSWMGLSGFDNTAWVRRFAQAARPGPYLRVVSEGEVRAGDEIRVVHRPGHGVTVSTMFRALHLDHTLLPQLLAVPDLVEQPRLRAEEYSAGRDGWLPAGTPRDLGYGHADRA